MILTFLKLGSESLCAHLSIYLSNTLYLQVLRKAKIFEIMKAFPNFLRFMKVFPFSCRFFRKSFYFFGTQKCFAFLLFPFFCLFLPFFLAKAYIFQSLALFNAKYRTNDYFSEFFSSLFRHRNNLVCSALLQVWQA